MSLSDRSIYLRANAARKALADIADLRDALDRAERAVRADLADDAIISSDLDVSARAGRAIASLAAVGGTREAIGLLDPSFIEAETTTDDVIELVRETAPILLDDADADVATGPFTDPDAIAETLSPEEVRKALRNAIVGVRRENGPESEVALTNLLRVLDGDPSEPTAEEILGEDDADVIKGRELIKSIFNPEDDPYGDGYVYPATTAELEDAAEVLKATADYLRDTAEALKRRARSTSDAYRAEVDGEYTRALARLTPPYNVDVADLGAIFVAVDSLLSKN